jgi:formate-nitrite transporter family protein
VDDGATRLDRSWPSLLATGVVGGVDVGVGVLALLIVQHESGNKLLAALAFGIGFMALTLATSELFTENFLVPIAAVAAGRPSPLRLVRLWLGTLAANLVGGWIFVGLIMAGLPHLRTTALELGSHPPELGLGSVALASAVVAGAAITLMTWMEQTTESDPSRLLVAVATGFVLAAGALLHAVVISLEMFAALQVGAPFGYLDWLGVLGWAVLGNVVGGIGLVTGLRLLQVGRGTLEEVRQA